MSLPKLYVWRRVKIALEALFQMSIILGMIVKYLLITVYTKIKQKTFAAYEFISWEIEVRKSRAEDFWYDLKCGVRNFWTFRKEVWRFKPYDHAFMLRLMERASSEMHDHLSRHGLRVGRTKTLRRIKVFSILCRRVADEKYYEYEPYFEYNGKPRKGKPHPRYVHVRYQMDNDMNHLTYLLAKYGQNWWD